MCTVFCVHTCPHIKGHQISSYTGVSGAQHHPRLVPLAAWRCSWGQCSNAEDTMAGQAPGAQRHGPQGAASSPGGDGGLLGRAEPGGDPAALRPTIEDQAWAACFQHCCSLRSRPLPAPLPRMRSALQIRVQTRALTRARRSQ